MSLKIYSFLQVVHSHSKILQNIVNFSNESPLFHRVLSNPRNVRGVDQFEHQVSTATCMQVNESTIDVIYETASDEEYLFFEKLSQQGSNRILNKEIPEHLIPTKCQNLSMH